MLNCIFKLPSLKFAKLLQITHSSNKYLGIFIPFDVLFRKNWLNAPNGTRTHVSWSLVRRENHTPIVPFNLCMFETAICKIAVYQPSTFILDRYINLWKGQFQGPMIAPSKGELRLVQFTLVFFLIQHINYKGKVRNQNKLGVTGKRNRTYNPIET